MKNFRMATTLIGMLMGMQAVAAPVCIKAHTEGRPMVEITIPLLPAANVPSVKPSLTQRVLNLFRRAPEKETMVSKSESRLQVSERVRLRPELSSEQIEKTLQSAAEDIAHQFYDTKWGGFDRRDYNHEPNLMTKVRKGNQLDIDAAVRLGEKLERAGALDMLATELNRQGKPYLWINGLDLGNPVHLERFAMLIGPGRILQPAQQSKAVRFLLSSPEAETFLNFYFHNDVLAGTGSVFKYGVERDSLFTFTQQLKIQWGGFRSLLNNDLSKDTAERGLMSGWALLNWFENATTSPEFHRYWKVLSQMNERARQQAFEAHPFLQESINHRERVNSLLKKLDIQSNMTLSPSLSRAQRIEQQILLARLYRMYGVNQEMLGHTLAERQMWRMAVATFLREYNLLESNSAVAQIRPWSPAAILRVQNWIKSDVYSTIRATVLGQESVDSVTMLPAWRWWYPLDAEGNAVTKWQGVEKVGKVHYVVNSGDADRRPDLSQLRLAVTYANQQPVLVEANLRNPDGTWRNLAFDVIDGELVPRR